MPTIAGILTFISMINTTSESIKARTFFIWRYFSVNGQLQFRAQLSWAWKKFYKLGARTVFQIIPHYLDLCCQATCVHVIGCTTFFMPCRTMSVCIIICLYNFGSLYYKQYGELNGRVIDSRPKGRWLEPHGRHCVVVIVQDTFILA